VAPPGFSLAGTNRERPREAGTLLQNQGFAAAGAVDRASGGTFEPPVAGQRSFHVAILFDPKPRVGSDLPVQSCAQASLLFDGDYSLEIKCTLSNRAETFRTTDEGRLNPFEEHEVVYQGIARAEGGMWAEGDEGLPRTGLPQTTRRLQERVT